VSIVGEKNVSEPGAICVSSLLIAFLPQGLLLQHFTQFSTSEGSRCGYGMVIWQDPKPLSNMSDAFGDVWDGLNLRRML